MLHFKLLNRIITKIFRKNTLSNKNKINYSKKELKEKVYSALEETGVILSDNEKSSNKDLVLTEYLHDSLHTILFLVSLERNLGYDIADEILIKKNLKSINSIVDTLYNAKLQKTSN